MCRKSKENKNKTIIKKKEGRNCTCDLPLSVITNHGGPSVRNGAAHPVSQANYSQYCIICQ